MHTLEHMKKKKIVEKDLDYDIISQVLQLKKDKQVQISINKGFWTCLFSYFSFVLFFEFTTFKNFFKYFCVMTSLDG